MDITERIKELIRLLANGKQNYFAEVTGIPTGTLSGILGKRTSDPSFSTLMKIINAYPNLNLHWFLYGIGEPLIDYKQKEGSQQEKEEFNKTDSEISERVHLVIDRLSTNRNTFAADLGYAKSQTIYDITDGKSAPSYDFFRRFMLSEYSEIVNINWLLTGRGKMIIDTETESDLEPSEDSTERAIFKMIRKVVADNALLEAKLEKLEKKK
jgi:transcriptional regulator with XRE-family HTH domain